MRIFSVVFFLLAGLTWAFSSGPPSPTAEAAANDAFDPAWARDSLWDDGRAEVALYQARRPQYGKIESYEALFVVVKEDFDPDLHVKADPPYQDKKLLPVLKLNAAHSYWTANYPYHFLASVFVRRDDPTRLVKQTVGSQEWCGNTFKEVKAWTDPPRLHFHSYFDGEADDARALDLRPGDLLEDQLPLALRGLRFQPGLRLERRIWPSLISNNLRGSHEPVAASIQVVGKETIQVPAGRFPAWKVTLQMGDLQQTWWFDQEAPHIMLQMESSDGRAWRLKSRTRKAYWQAPTFAPEM